MEIWELCSYFIVQGDRPLPSHNNRTPNQNISKSDRSLPSHSDSASALAELRTPPKHLKKRSLSPILQASLSTIPGKQKAMLLAQCFATQNFTLDQNDEICDNQNIININTF